MQISNPHCAPTSRVRSVQGATNSNPACSKKSRISQACIICRKKKIKCNGIRPSCGYCMESGFPCMYTAPKRRGPPRRMPVLGTGTDTSANPPSTLPKKGNKSHPAMQGTSSATSAATSRNPIGLETPEEHARHLQSSTTHASTLLMPSSAETSAPGFLPPPNATLSDKITFLISFNKSGRVSYIRNLGPSNGAQYLSHLSLDFHDGIFMMEEPEGSTFASMTGKKKELLEKLDPYEMPSERVQDALTDFYFEYLRPFFPILDKAQVKSYRKDSANANRTHFVLHAFYAFCSLWHYRLQKHADSSFSCPMLHVKKAKQLLPTILEDPPSLNNVCGLLFLAITESGDLQGNSWMLTGMAVRMAQDMGLHLDFRRLSVHSIFLPVQLKRAQVAWWGCYFMDRMHAVVLGRPVGIHIDEPDAFLRALRAEAAAGSGGLTDAPSMDPDPHQPVTREFATLLRLVHIQGHIAAHMNAMHSLDAHQIHLHSLSLEKWLADLPAQLQFSFETQHAPTPFALHLNLLYYFTVLLLYRPCLRSGPEYPATLLANATSICSTTIKAILAILEAARAKGILNALSVYTVHSLMVCGSSLYIMYSNPSPQLPLPQLAEFSSKILEFLNEMVPIWPMLGAFVDLHKQMLQALSSATPQMATSAVVSHKLPVPFLPVPHLFSGAVATQAFEHAQLAHKDGAAVAAASTLYPKPSSLQTPPTSAFTLDLRALATPPLQHPPPAAPTPPAGAFPQSLAPMSSAHELLTTFPPTPHAPASSLFSSQVSMKCASAMALMPFPLEHPAPPSSESSPVSVTSSVASASTPFKYAHAVAQANPATSASSTPSASAPSAPSSTPTTASSSHAAALKSRTHFPSMYLNPMSHATTPVPPTHFAPSSSTDGYYAYAHTRAPMLQPGDHRSVLTCSRSTTASPASHPKYHPSAPSESYAPTIVFPHTSKGEDTPYSPSSVPNALHPLAKPFESKSMHLEPSDVELKKPPSTHDFHAFPPHHHYPSSSHLYTASHPHPAPPSAAGAPQQQETPSVFWGNLQMTPEFWESVPTL